MSELKTYEVVVTVKARNTTEAQIAASPDPSEDLSIYGVNDYEVVNVGEAQEVKS